MAKIKKVIEPPKVELKKVTPELICAVLRGDYGEGTERNAKLREEGYSPSVVTKKLKFLREIADEVAPYAIAAGDYFVCLTYFFPKA